LDSPASDIAFADAFGAKPYLARHDDDEIDEVADFLESAPSFLDLGDDCTAEAPGVVDETAGYLYVLCNTAFELDEDSRLYVLDGSNPGFAFGTKAASTFFLNEHYSGLLKGPSG